MSLENKMECDDLATLLSLAEEISRIKADGHLTIMRFTSHWKCTLGTPGLMSGDNEIVKTAGREHGGGYREVLNLQGYTTLEKALRDLIIRS